MFTSNLPSLFLDEGLLDRGPVDLTFVYLAERGSQEVGVVLLGLEQRVVVFVRLNGGSMDFVLLDLHSSAAVTTISSSESSPVEISAVEGDVVLVALVVDTFTNLWNHRFFNLLFLLFFGSQDSS